MTGKTINNEYLFGILKSLNSSPVSETWNKRVAIDFGKAGNVNGSILNEATKLTDILNKAGVTVVTDGESKAYVPSPGAVKAYCEYVSAVRSIPTAPKPVTVETPKTESKRGRKAKVAKVAL